MRLNLKLSMNAVDLLTGRHGSDLAAIANAIAKAAINCGDRGRIEEADLDEGGSSRIPDIFELAESVARGNPARPWRYSIVRSRPVAIRSNCSRSR